MGPVRAVIAEVRLGDRVPDTETRCAAMVLGLLALGNSPTAWSGRPLALNERNVLLHDQVAVAVALTDGESLNTLEA